MSFRTMEISNEAEIHIKSNQLEIATAEGVCEIPLEDLSNIFVHGANIRLSTMDLSILSQNKVSLTTLDEKYLPTAIVLPFEGNSRQSMLMHAQVNTSKEIYRNLWVNIIRQKITNQSHALSILGLPGTETVGAYISDINEENADYKEALAAKEYFAQYHEGLNRRLDDPVNSRLNYGYAVVRSSIARSLVATGFHPAFGIHHDNQLNAFNLADDLIEPYRPIVDLVAHRNIGSNIKLSKSERHEMAHVLHNACVINSTKVNVLTAIDSMCESLKRIILDCSSEKLLLPTIIPIDSLEGITEYANLRRFLIRDGYLRIAPEVFMRIVGNRKTAEKHYRRIEEFAPKTGTVRLLRLTEKQFSNIYMLTGAPDYQEKTVGTNCHIML